MAFAAPLEVLTYRILWSIPLLGGLVLFSGQWREMRNLSRRAALTLGACAILLSINWLTFIYGIHAGRIAETSLGYFLNPLVSIVLGAFVLGERLRRWQWVAAVLAGSGVCIELLMFGALPWVALVLAVSFGFYGLLRKQIVVPAALGLGLETCLLAPFALGFLLFGLEDVERSANEVGMLALGGVVTVLPLIWFGAAAIRLPLTQLGFFQYLAPSLSLVLAVAVYDETVTLTRWLSFGVVWFAIAIFSAEMLWFRRKTAVARVVPAESGR